MQISVMWSGDMYGQDGDMFSSSLFEILYKRVLMVSRLWHLVNI